MKKSFIQTASEKPLFSFCLLASSQHLSAICPSVTLCLAIVSHSVSFQPPSMGSCQSWQMCLQMCTKRLKLARIQKVKGELWVCRWEEWRHPEAVNVIYVKVFPLCSALPQWNPLYRHSLCHASINLVSKASYGTTEGRIMLQWRTSTK